MSRKDASTNGGALIIKSTGAAGAIAVLASLREKSRLTRKTSVFDTLYNHQRRSLARSNEFRFG